MANVGPNAWYLSSVAYTAVAAWTTGTKTAGTLVRQNAAPAVGSERVFVCIIGGAAGGAEPTWVLTKGAKTTDGSATWMEVTGQPGVNGDITNSPTWTQNKNTAVTLGLIIYNSGNSSLQIVTTAGTTGNGGTPAFSATAGTTTTDNTATWTSLGPASNFGIWAAPFARAQSIFVGTWGNAGDTVYAADNHAETQSTAMSILGLSGSVISSWYSVSHTGTLPKTAVTSGAHVATTGGSTITIQTGFYFNGFTILAGSGSSLANIVIGSTSNGGQRYENCVLGCSSTASGGKVQFGSAADVATELVNTSFSFAHISQSIWPSNPVTFYWRDTPTPFSNLIPTTLFNLGNSDGCSVIIEGVDLSGITNLLPAAPVNSNRISLVNCRTLSTLTVTSIPTQGNWTVDLICCDNAATDYNFTSYRYQGTLTCNTAIIRTGGASNGTTGVSYQIATTTGPAWVDPFQTTPISDWNTEVAQNAVITLHGIWSASTLPNNDQIWVSVQYLGSSGYPLASVATQTKASGLAAGSPLPTDTASAWDSQIGARANSTGYSLGNVVKVASNAGRIFFCITAGTSAGTEPGGYASATDGTSITDGTAVFQAGVRFLLQVTLSSPQPLLAGYLRATVMAALPSATFYVDPLIVIT